MDGLFGETDGCIGSPPNPRFQRGVATTVAGESGGVPSPRLIAAFGEFPTAVSGEQFPTIVAFSGDFATTAFSGELLPTTAFSEEPPTHISEELPTHMSEELPAAFSGELLISFRTPATRRKSPIVAGSQVWASRLPDGARALNTAAAWRQSMPSPKASSNAKRESAVIASPPPDMACGQAGRVGGWLRTNDRTSDELYIRTSLSTMKVATVSLV